MKLLKTSTDSIRCPACSIPGGGWCIFFAVQDNGNGKNDPVDKYGEEFFLLQPEAPLYCGAMSRLYESMGIPFLDGQDPTRLQIK